MPLETHKRSVSRLVMQPGLKGACLPCSEPGLHLALQKLGRVDAHCNPNVWEV